MKKIIFILLITIFSSLSLNADMLFGNNDYCIDEYYYQNGSLYYKRSKNQHWYKVTSNNRQAKIYYGFEYNSTSNKCLPDITSQTLGMSYSEYKFLMALSGLLIGFGIYFGFITIFSRR